MTVGIVVYGHRRVRFSDSSARAATRSFGSARLSPTPSPCWRNTGRTYATSMTCAWWPHTNRSTCARQSARKDAPVSQNASESASLPTTFTPTLSWEDSPVRTSATPAPPTPADCAALTASDLDYGESSTGLFAKRSPGGWLSKTSAPSLFADSIAFSETWPMAGTMRSGRCYRRPPWAHPTYESGSLSSPGGLTFFRTPTARDWKGQSAASWRNREKGDPTPTLPDQLGGVPRPEFVEALMGYPVGWTALPVVFERGESIPHRKERIREIGNAVDTRVTEWIARQIAEYATN